MKKVLITGAGSGLGKAMALRYAKDGAQICVADLNAQAAEDVSLQITNAGGSAFFAECDITKQTDVDALTSTLNERWGSVDILVNNAGVATAGSIESESFEQWQWVLDINVLGHVRMTKAMLPLLRQSNAQQKNIINIASQAGITPAPAMGSYSLSKAAMVSFSETSYLEFVHDNIMVSVVCPSFFDTNLNKSLRSNDSGMQNVVDKMIKKSGVEADEIADKILKGVNAGKFMILTHKYGIRAYRLKRFLPIERYLKMVAEKTKRYVKKSA